MRRLLVGKLSMRKAQAAKFSNVTELGFNLRRLN